MHIPGNTPRFKGTLIAYVPEKDVELKSVLINDMKRYTRDVASFPDRVEFRFQTEKSHSTSRYSAFRNRIRQKLAMIRLGDWNGKYAVRYGFDTGIRTEKPEATTKPAQ